MNQRTLLDRDIHVGMSSFSKTVLVLLIWVSLLISAANMGINQAQAQSLPPSIVYSIPITLTNTQPVATSAPFQQMIEVNSATFSDHESSNLQNIEFFYADGALIPSWLESGNTKTATNTVYWLSIANGIPAASTITVYMGFASASTNLFNTQTTGEAPELSPIYGQYDSGGKVFPFYDNFAGNTLKSLWTSYTNGGTITVNNGLIIQGASGSMQGYDAVTEIDTNVNGAQFSGPSVFDIYFQEKLGQGPNFRFGFRDGDLCDVQDGLSGNGIAVDWGNNGGANGFGNSIQITSTESTPSTSSNTYTLTSTTNTNYNVFSIAAERSIAQFYLNYAPTSPSTLNTHIPPYSPSIGIGLEENYDSTGVNASWVRTRSYPPNDVMPTVTINGQTQRTNPSITLYSASINGLKVSIDGVAQATTPKATITNISWQWGDGKTTNGLFPQTHTYAQPGTYQVTVTTTDTNGLASSTSESISVSAQNSGGGVVPPYAFNGSLATYQITSNYSFGSATSEVTYSITNVNDAAQSFDASVNYSGSLSPLSSSVPASFSYPSPFSAVSPADLKILSQGNAPPDMPRANVTSDVTISVPAGTFTTDEISNEIYTTWVEVHSGLIVKESGIFLPPGSMLVAPSSTMVLEETNIPLSGSSANVLLYIAITLVALAVISGGGLLSFKRKKNIKPVEAIPAPPPPPPPESTESLEEHLPLERVRFKLNIAGIFGAIVLLISIALPWWTMILSIILYGYSSSTTTSAYLYQVSSSGMPFSNIWFCTAALVLVVLGGLLGLIGSLLGKRPILAAGAYLAISSIIVFIVGLQNELSSSNSSISMFAAGSSTAYTTYFTEYTNYTTYLSAGFWLALVAAIIMFAATRRKRARAEKYDGTTGSEERERKID